MKARQDGITREQLKTLLDYNPETGKFIWKVDINNRHAGDIAGCETTWGYNRICIYKREYRCARLAWLYMTGIWPTNEVDHKDRNRRNDSWSNLRQANRFENGSNRRNSLNNTSGYKGVVWLKHRNTWAARIRSNGKTRDVGYSKDPMIAAALYDSAAKMFHGDFCSLNFSL